MRESRERERERTSTRKMTTDEFAVWLGRAKESEAHSKTDSKLKK